MERLAGGDWIPRSREKVAADAQSVKRGSRISRLVIFFWLCGGLFIPVTMYLMLNFSISPGYASGGGNWGSGFMVLFVGLGLVTPTIIACGSLTLLSSEARKRGHPTAAAVFALLAVSSLVFLPFELDLLLELLDSDKLYLEFVWLKPLVEVAHHGISSLH
jgi:hypothetical protein